MPVFFLLQCRGLQEKRLLAQLFVPEGAAARDGQYGGCVFVDEFHYPLYWQYKVKIPAGRGFEGEDAEQSVFRIEQPAAARPRFEIG